MHRPQAASGMFLICINFFYGEFQFKEQITRLPTTPRLDILNLARAMSHGHGIFETEWIKNIVEEY